MAISKFEAMEEERLRRKRIDRMKNGIIMTIAIWMLTSLIAIIILSVQVIKLNHQMKEMMGTHVESNDTGTDRQSEKESQTVDNSNIETGVDAEDNLAKEGDTHYVYLTFNSVPGDNTEAILDVLAQQKVKATFFVEGTVEVGTSEVYQRIVEEGHTIGMHSYSNQYSLIYSSKDAFESDYKKISDYIYELTGKRSKFYRFPGGSGNTINNVSMTELVSVLNKEKITYFDWNVSAGDNANTYTVQEIHDNVLKGVSKYKTSVVLMHDDNGKSTTVEALGSLIEKLKNQGAVVLPIDENTKVIQHMKAESIK